MADCEKNSAVNNLRDYLRIRSVHPNVNYDECITYLQRQASELGLPCRVHHVLPGKPVLVMTWQGTQPALPSILLNSHMDVVPVFEKSWKYPPFAAKLVDGVVYARGAQDMKSVAVQYIEAVRQMKKDGVTLKRTIHLSFVPDEEIGGKPGMGEFVKTPHFAELNIGFALDEGLASETEQLVVYNAERSIWHVTIICPGTSGHGSLLMPNNCGVKLRYIIDKFMDLREQSVRQLQDNPELTVGDVTSVNLTMISGGIQNNVVPEEMRASFDLRLALSVDLTQFEEQIRQWCVEAGSDVRYEFAQKDEYVPPTTLDDNNAFWKAFKTAAQSLNIPLRVATFPGGTDSRYLRAKALPALGVTPLTGCKQALHQHNESIPVDKFLSGIQFYVAVCQALANAPN